MLTFDFGGSNYTKRNVDRIISGRVFKPGIVVNIYFPTTLSKATHNLGHRVVLICGMNCITTAIPTYLSLPMTDKPSFEIPEYEGSERKLKKDELQSSGAKDLVYVYDTKGNILFINKVFEKLTGHRIEGFIGKSFAPLYDEENLKKALDVYTRTLQGESPWFDLRFKDTGIVCEYKNFPLSDDDGTIIGVFGIARDITQLRREEELGKISQILQTLIHASPLAVGMIDRRGKVLMWSPAAEQLFGWRSADVIGRFLPTIPEDQREGTLEAIEAKLSREIHPASVARRLKKDGSLIDVMVWTSPLRNVKGEIMGIIEIFANMAGHKRIEEELRILNESLEHRVAERTSELIELNKELLMEIHERRQAEEALRISESKYRLLLNNLPQRIFLKDKNLVYMSCNDNLARDLHIKPDEIIGKTDYDFYPRELAEGYRAGDKRVMESGQTDDTEEKYVRDGQEFIIRMVRTPIRDEDDNIAGILGSFLDITEKITLEREANRSKQLASLGELATGVAHEINNPITGVINCAQIIFNKSSEGSREKDIAGRIIKEGDRIANLAGKLLSFVRFYDRKEQESIVCISQIIDDAFLLTEAQLRKEGICVKMDIPQDLPKIIAYSQQIQQVFMNIINNARYAMNQKYPEGHDNKILEILGEEITINGSPYVKITFHDHGIGIPAHSKDKIMEPFFTTKPRGVGTGLGLSISHTIIKDHGGKLIVDSVEGEFTRISVILPAELKPL